MATKLPLKPLFQSGLVMLLLSGCAAPPSKALDFETRAEREIDAVVRFAPPRFASERAPEAGFLFYQNNRLDFTKCERAVLLGLMTNGKRSGSIGAGLCSDAKAIQTLAQSTQEYAKSMVEWLKKGAGSTDPAAFERPLWRHTKTTGPDGSEIHYFPVPVAGHGFAVFPTVVLVGERQAIVVQANVEPLCSGDVRPPLCTDPVAALREIAQRVYARWGRS